MRSRQPFAITTVAEPHMVRCICETDIRDYYVPSPIAATGSLRSPLRIPPVPLPTHRLVRRGRD